MMSFANQTTSGHRATAIGRTLFAAALLGVAVNLAPVKDAHATISVAVCEQAIEAANNFYAQASANKKLYPTLKDAKEGADRYFRRRIRDESGKTIKSRADGIAECATRTTKGKRHYGGLFTY